MKVEFVMAFVRPIVVSRRRTLSRRTYGPWMYVSQTNALQLRAYPSACYEVDLDRCRTDRQRTDWIRHVSQKAWGTSDVVDGLREAFAELEASA